MTGGDTGMRAFAPCAVIPIYNHWRTISGMVERLRAWGLPVLIVDDGSDEATQAVLRELAEAGAGVRLHRLAINQGKGRAVTTGLLAAYRAGYSHALQIDADGQHDTGDVPRFLDMARAHPDALVCGCPVYDDSVPRARLYGRYLTHVCVWIETLSLRLRDSMCGYRLYPLATTVAAIAAHAPPARMDFDTEIAVRLIWRGMPVRNLPTRVTYPADGLSHFRPWRDNVRISVMHMRLLSGMLWRAPMLLARSLRRDS